MQPVKNIFVYNDPFLNGNSPSHHPELFKYVFDLLESHHSLHLVPELNVSRRISKFRFVHLVEMTRLLTSNAILILWRIRKEKSSNRVVYFNPNIDPLSLSLFLIFRKLSTLDFEVRLRFICTVDRFLTSKKYLVHKYLQFIGSLFLENDKLTAESISYAVHLTENFRFPVDYLEYPPVNHDKRIIPKELNQKLRILFIGKPRRYKGYEQLPYLVSKLGDLRNVEFRIQCSVEKDSKLSDVSNKLRGLPHVELLAPVLSIEEIVAEVKECDILLLPYDVNIFKYRNSAFAFMGLYFGKYVASYRGSSMHDSASKLGLDVDLLDIQNSVGQINRNSRSDIGLSSEYVSERWYLFLQ